jgi:hypothetical protein
MAVPNRGPEHPILDPLLAVLEATAGEFILTAKERAANAARDAVVEARRGGVDEMAAGRGHGDSLAPCERVVCQRIARQRVGELLFDACPGLRDSMPAPVAAASADCAATRRKTGIRCLSRSGRLAWIAPLDACPV